MDLRSASAEAVADLTDELETQVAGAVDRSGVTTMADDLFGVAATLRAEGGLRRFVTDTTVPTEAQRGLVEEVFGDKVSEGARAVLGSAVGRRWTATRDLADALERLGVVAHVLSAGDESGRLTDELFEFGEAAKQHPDLRAALSDPARSLDDKAQLVEDLLGARALPATVALVKHALVGSHRTVAAALTAYQQVAAEVHGQRVAVVRVARELTEAESRRLADALSAQYGRPVHLNLLVDPEVLGGIRVEIGDDVIDGTVSSRLDEARRRLVG